MNRFSRVLALILMVTLGVTIGVAQTSRGTITGTVTDPSGAVVANATVTITDQATNVVRTTKTNSSGIYRFDAVNLGTYTIKYEAAGFAPASVSDFVVSANRVLGADMKLKVGSSSDNVTVEATGELQLQTTEQVRAENISAARVANLPVVGQNSLNLMLTVPGVATSDMGGSLNSGIGSVNGSRPRGNNFLIDGVENNDISVAGPALTPTNTDAIQEVAIQTSNFSAEFGRAGGAVVNQITKSGTNQLHGTLAWVYRSELFDAANRDQKLSFVPGGPDPLKTTYKENIPAFTIGGPVVIPHLYDGRDKTFFFAAGQWDRASSGGSITTFRVPTAAGIATLQSLAAAGCTRAQLYLDSIGNLVAPTAAANVPLAIPAATFTNTGSCNGTDRTGMVLPVGTAGRAVPTLFLNNNHQVRVDHRINDKQQFMARWLYSNDFQPNGGRVGTTPAFDADFTGRTMGITLNHTYAIAPSMTNEFRFNYGRINFQFPFSQHGVADTLPSIAFAGSSNMSSIGMPATFPQGRVANNWQYQDVVTVVRGTHSFRMGADYLRQIAAQRAPANIRGSLGYTSTGSISGFSNFLDDFGGDTGIPAQQFGTPLYRPNLFRQAYFIQDSWRLKSNLTVNLGLRYENFGQPANFFKYPVVQLDPANFSSQERVKQDNNNFGPTVGFAYTPQFWNSFFGDQKTVIRGGFQVSYDTFFNNMLSNMAGGNPNLVGNVPVNPPASLTGANERGTANMSTRLAGLTPAPLNPVTNASSQFTKDIVNPYTMRWSFGVQRELPSNFIVDLSYVGAGARKLFQTVELNPFTPNATHTGRSTARLRPTIGARQARASIGASNYHSMQLEMKRGLKETVIGDLTFTSAYTWSKSIDGASEIFVSNQNGGTTSTNGSSIGSSQWIVLLQPGRHLDRGPSDFDIRHTWVSTALWNIRGPKQGFWGQVAGGWGLSFVVPVQSGSPYTIFNNRDRDFDGSSIADRPDIGNPNAPFESYALAVPTGTCSTGLQNPAIGTTPGVGCVTANDVHFIQVAGSPTSDPGANTVRRNAMRTPDSWLVHMNVIKTFKLSERFKLEYRAEIFNLLNHENHNYTPTGIVLDGSSLFDYSQGNPLGSPDIFTTNARENRRMRMGLKVIF